jgi:hypothetical protein
MSSISRALQTLCALKEFDDRSLPFYCGTFGCVSRKNGCWMETMGLPFFFLSLFLFSLFLSYFVLFLWITNLSVRRN